MLAPSIYYCNTRRQWSESFDPAWFAYGKRLGLEVVYLSSFNKDQSAKDISESCLLVLPGGGDLYSISGQDFDRKRDEFYKDLYEVALLSGAKVLGVCRGAQFLNNHLGGSLSPVAGHAGVTHKVFVEESMVVNSYHNWGIAESGLSSRLSPLAKDESGYIEAFIDKNQQVMGILWHPERDGNSEESYLFIEKYLFNKSS